MHDQGVAAALRAAQDGDAAGFELLWRALQPAVRRYLQVMVGQAADDVASETWLQVARDLTGFRGDGVAFRVWLFRIARNRGIDYLRRGARRPEEPDSEAEPHRLTVPDTALEVLDALGTQWALRLIAALPRNQAEAVMLRVVAGLDVAQAARVLGRRPGAVRVAAMRGLRNLAHHPEVLARRTDRTTRPADPVDCRDPAPRTLAQPFGVDRTSAGRGVTR